MPDSERNRRALAEAEKMSARPVLPNENQKFQPGDMVRLVREAWPLYKQGQFVTIQYSYGQKYGGDNFRDYSIVGERGTLAWVDQDDMEKTPESHYVQ